MSGLIALVGGNEFRPPCRPMDLALLALLGEGARVMILPTAARDNPALAVENGVRYFQGLGAVAGGLNILEAADARDPAQIAKMEDADLLYLTGGDPSHLLETLKGSPAWETVVRLRKKGRLLAGSSAGAMILGARIWIPGKGWREGLGALPQIAVIPHHATLAVLWGVQEMRTSLPEGITLVGIDEATALAGPPWRVFGTGKVSLYPRQNSPASVAVFSEGQEIASLPPEFF